MIGLFTLFSINLAIAYVGINAFLQHVVIGLMLMLIVVFDRVLSDYKVSSTLYVMPFEKHNRNDAFEGLFEHISEGKQIDSIIMTSPQIVLRSNLTAYERWRREK